MGTKPRVGIDPSRSAAIAPTLLRQYGCGPIDRQTVLCLLKFGACRSWVDEIALEPHGPTLIFGVICVRTHARFLNRPRTLTSDWPLGVEGSRSDSDIIRRCGLTKFPLRRRMLETDLAS